MKYTLNCYGWSAEFIGKSITKEQTKMIEDLKDSEGADELWEIRHIIDDEMEFDIWDGDLLHINKPLNAETVYFELEDADGKKILMFYGEDMESIDGNDPYEVFPTEEYDVFFTIDENKGGICTYVIESDTVPTLKDFKYYSNIVDNPSGYWEIIDGISFRGGLLDEQDFLDSNGKSSEVYIFKEPLGGE